MNADQIQDTLDEAERLHAAGATVDQGRVGAIDLNGATMTVTAAVWMAMRAILIGRGFKVENDGLGASALTGKDGGAAS